MCLLSISVFAQRPQYAKMSPLLRQLARTSSNIRHYSPSIRTASVCAFVKVDDGGDEALHQKGCQVLARAGQIRIASIPVSQLGALSLDHRILRMEARQGTQLTNDQMATHLNALPVYAGQNLPQAFTGQGVVVGVMDVGFDLTHPTFYNNDTTQYRIRRFWDMLTQDTIGSPLYVGRDYAGRDELLALGHSRDGLDLTHGTHTAGTAAGTALTGRPDGKHRRLHRNDEFLPELRDKDRGRKVLPELRNKAELNKQLADRRISCSSSRNGFGKTAV
jgi:hypothetical protein